MRRDLDSSYDVVDNGFETPCWIYTGFIDRKGYGEIHTTAGLRLAHRVYYERDHGAIGVLHLHHRCAVRRCVNPEHLEPVTIAEHAAIEAAKRTHCHRGHSYADYGRRHTNGRGRYCRACQLENERRVRAERATA